MLLLLLLLLFTLIHVQQKVAAANDHALDGQVLSNVFRLANLVVHLLVEKRLVK